MVVKCRESYRQDLAADVGSRPTPADLSADLNSLLLQMTNFYPFIVT